MFGIGTILNVFTIIVGSIIGLLLKHNLKDKYKLIMIQGVGLTTLVFGSTGAIEGIIKSTNEYIFLIIILSIVIGSLIGTYLKIEERLNNVGEYIQNKFKDAGNHFSSGFVRASLIFCVGAMAITGSINDGLSGDYSILALKAILDGITSMILASTLGFGVLFSFIPVFIYQGSITVLAYYFGNFISISVKEQMTIIGNMLIIGIGIELLDIRKIKISDMLPAIFLPIIYDIFISIIQLIY